MCVCVVSGGDGERRGSVMVNGKGKNEGGKNTVHKNLHKHTPKAKIIRTSK